MVRRITLNSNFMFGASDIKSLPNESAPEIAFAGRSNVGKSSLINLLINSKKAARVSSKPGCTRQINFYSMYNDKFRLVDLPGYGCSHASKDETIQYLGLVEYYLIHRRNLRRVFVLIDSKVRLKEIDKDFIYWLTYNNINFDVVLTKIDKVDRENLDAIIESTRKWINNESVSIRQISVRVKYEMTKVRDEFFKFTR
ncbi:YihA family ribosome biogenesis GTP-binding protein [Wolbachia endosymbiont of Brugia malayi]|uniref:Probable GTP-binding protein EngB n=1 Tax=Wolbachia sp. subsp. Brugia malayi (strain TRS) TaxID=292805 RepID=ENGB_WOLTR|nr:ribosome biogenesis GTP-binding protein YihA/YsxC [Wolbachia endosymbiont of Brugia malayi]Q5GSS9.2 RecName: Full=Probable GTP-binding protein EngB [Wolbachia endosymbiont strain TRS of Brugia malayi]QCB61899.1 YihA family ribosome biogenesis GTP-binding protein [Wolbachia endosymbiont of Brugia malayi]